MTTTAPATIDMRNRLGAETSPYLLQHRENPVHWFAWGDEAFAAARALDRPIFLSIGYSTCYWCHVMERESFENDEVAAILNASFVAIKVDREERPDVDDLYMAATQALNRGQGGWPMSVFLEPKSLRPFLAGTYFPPDDRFGRPGFKSMLNHVAELWSQRRAAIVEQAAHVADVVARQLTVVDDPRALSTAPVADAVALLMGVYDDVHGGFGRGPNKFPTPVNLDFLIAAGWERSEVRRAILHTLDRMATGGMYDQIGGGFHRYSTDERWLVPHFEKMLYDNGQLASTYAEAFERTRDPFYAKIVRSTGDWAMREMAGPGGAFASAQDAEVNHLEGENYLWTESQVREALGAAGLADEADFALAVYGVANGANFRDPHHPEAGWKNVLYLAQKPAPQAGAMGLAPEVFDERLARVNAALLAARSRRDQPLTDDKILAGWNGLMIAGLADGGRVLGEEKYVEAARRASAYLLQQMRSPDGGLLRTARGGTARVPAFLEDYAFVIRGLLALHRATGDAVLLEEARSLAVTARDRFRDESTGAYFDTLPDQSDLFVRAKSIYDGATPSGNGMMVCNLLDLYELTRDDAWLDGAVGVLQALSAELVERPTVSPLALAGLRRALVIAPERFPADAVREPGAPGAPGTQPVRVSVTPNAVELGEASEARIEVRLAIAPGHHVNAAEPGADGLVPLRLSVVGAAGVRIAAEYPAGERFDGPLGAMLVHHGEVVIPVRLVRPAGRAAMTGEPRLMITYQACTDTFCLAPVTEEVPVAISLGGRDTGEQE